MMIDLAACLEQASEQVATRLGEVEVACLGEGPPILSIHGGPGGCDQGLVMALPFLQAGYRVIAPSRPGYLGTALERGVSLNDQADLLAALLEALRLPAIPVIGASAGGPPAYLLAARHPERVKSLVVIDGVSQIYHKVDQMNRLEEAIFLSRPGVWLMDWLGRHFPGPVVQSLMESESTLTPDDLKERVAEVVHNPSKLAFVQALMRTMSARFNERQLGVRNDLKQLAAITRLELNTIKCPTLVIHGDSDGDVPFADACWAHEQISGSMIHAIPGGSHLGFWIAPGAKQAQQLALSWIAI
ncbi:MAG: hypothetical protein RLZZ216_2437 [Cyanobacteriota bacterium]